jgi:hypothetical protein
MDTLRIGDADRERAVELLGEQYALGRLTKEEFDERSDAAWSARTRGDLAPLFADLPVKPAGPPPAGSVAPHRPRWWPVPLAPVGVALVFLTVITHMPFIVFGLVLFWCLGGMRHRHRWSRP